MKKIAKQQNIPFDKTVIEKTNRNDVCESNSDPVIDYDFFTICTDIDNRNRSVCHLAENWKQKNHSIDYDDWSIQNAVKTFSVTVMH